MSYYIMQFLFYAIPGAIVVLFVASLIMFCHAKIKNKRYPGSFTDSQIKTRKTLLGVSTAITIILVSVVLIYVALMFIAIAGM